MGTASKNGRTGSVGENELEVKSGPVAGRQQSHVRREKKKEGRFRSVQGLTKNKSFGVLQRRFYCRAKQTASAKNSDLKP
jgi:hypothetical protein